MAGSEMVANQQGNRRLALWLFCSFFFFYLLGSGGHISTPDGTILFRVTSRLAGSGRLDIRPLETWPAFGGMETTDPATGEKRFYAKYGIGASLAAVPFYWIGEALLPLSGQRERDVFDQNRWIIESEPGSDASGSVRARSLFYDTRRENFDEAFLSFVVSWSSALFIAGTLVGLFMTATRLGFSGNAALALAVAAGLASPLWHYSKTFFAEPLACLTVVWFVYFTVAGAESGAPRRAWIWAGMLLGAAVLVKIAHIVLVLPAGMLVMAYAKRWPRREAYIRVLLFALALGAVAGLTGVYNAVRFGMPLETGYGAEAHAWRTPLWEGLSGLWFSAGRGLLIYCPLVMLSAAAFPRFARRQPALGLFTAFGLGMLTIFYARWHMWEGGWCWGPRFLLPLVPVLLLPLAEFLESPPHRRAGRIAMFMLIAVAFVVALGGTIVNYHDYCRWLRYECEFKPELLAARGANGYYDLMRWDWSFAPVVRYWSFPIKDYFLLRHALKLPGLVLGLFGVFLAGFLVSAAGLWREWRRDSKSLVRREGPAVGVRF